MDIRFLKKKIDVVDLFGANTILRAEVAYHGKRVYCADDYRADLFQVTAIAQLLSLDEEQSELLNDIRKRGSILLIWIECYSIKFILLSVASNALKKKLTWF